MVRRSWFVLACASIPLVACGGSSGGGGDDEAFLAAVESLRHELAFRGVETLPDPPPVSDELFELGRALFFDKILSSNEDISCALPPAAVRYHRWAHAP